MNEQERLTCTEPHPILKFLSDRARPHKQRWYGWLLPDGIFYPSYPGLNWERNRKLRLFACTCCRTVWQYLLDERSRWAVEIAERFVDEKITRSQFQEASRDAVAVARDLSGEDIASSNDGELIHLILENLVGNGNVQCAAAWAAALTLTNPRWVSWATRAATLAAHMPVADWRQLNSEISGSEARYLRELFGNPFRPVTIAPDWLTWNSANIPKLAAAIYEHRALPAGTFDVERLSVLGDALEEAGCQDPEILGHCREKGAVHLRGCFLIDLLLGKE